MLVFDVKPPDKHGGIEVEAGSGFVCLVRPQDAGDFVVWPVGGLNIEYGVRAASRLHALELGVAAAARWLAVELLKDPAPPTAKLVEGVALDYATKAQADIHGNQRLVLRGRTIADLGWNFIGDGYVATHFLPARSDEPYSRQFASEEAALAALIEHAAPWIALALEKELKP